MGTPAMPAPMGLGWVSSGLLWLGFTIARRCGGLGKMEEVRKFCWVSAQVGVGLWLVLGFGQ